MHHHVPTLFWWWRMTRTRNWVRCNLCPNWIDTYAKKEPNFLMVSLRRPCAVPVEVPSWRVFTRTITMCWPTTKIVPQHSGLNSMSPELLPNTFMTPDTRQVGKQFYCQKRLKKHRRSTKNAKLRKFRNFEYFKFFNTENAELSQIQLQEKTCKVVNLIFWTQFDGRFYILNNQKWKKWTFDQISIILLE